MPSDRPRPTPVPAMPTGPEEHAGADPGLPGSTKIVIAGGFGVGKTTFVTTISEIDPITTEAAMTDIAVQVDDNTGVEGKTTTTVALDFGRITIDESMILYLFGTPGQDRFAFLWDEVSIGAVGAVVLVDTRRIDQCFGAIDYFESRSTPLVIGVNPFDGAPRFDLDEVREALDVPGDVPIVSCDARTRADVKATLVALLEHVLRVYDRAASPHHPVGAPAR